MAGFKNGLQKVGDVYHYCFRINRKQCKGSTRAHDLTTAKKVLEQKRREAIVGKPLVLREALTFPGLVKEWLATHSRTASARHLQNVELISRIWLTPYLGKYPIDEVTQGMILEVRSRMLEAGRSMATANHLLRVVKLLWNYAVDAGFIDVVPFKVKALRVQRKPRPWAAPISTALHPTTSLRSLNPLLPEVHPAGSLSYLPETNLPERRVEVFPVFRSRSRRGRLATAAGVPNAHHIH